MERNKEWVRRRSFPAKELEKSNSPVITKDLRAGFGLANICDARDAYIAPLDRGGMKIKGYRRNGRSLRGENLNGS